jgi:hypothetical protein
MRVILDRLILSSLSEASDPFFLAHHRVEAILYFGAGGLFPEDLKFYHRQLDGPSLSEEELRDGVMFLRESLRAGRRVVAVGETGATIVVAYLSEMGFGMAQSLQMVNDGSGRTPEADPEQVEAHWSEIEKRRNARVHN